MSHPRLRLIKQFVGPFWRKALLLALVDVSAAALMLACPLLSRRFIDMMADGSPSDKLGSSVALFLAVAALAQAASVCSTYLSEDLAWSSTNRMRLELVKRCLRFDPAFFRDHAPGALVERIDGDVLQIKSFLSRFVIDIFTNTLVIAGVLVVLSTIAEWLGFVFGLYTVIAALALSATQGIAAPRWGPVREVATDTAAYLEEAIAGREDLAANGAVRVAAYRYYELLRRSLDAAWKTGVAGNMTATVSNVCNAAGLVIATSAAAYLYVHGSVGLGSVVLIINCAWMILAPLGAYSGMVGDWARAGASIERIRALLALDAGRQDQGTLRPSSGPCAIKFDDVTFRYRPDEAAVASVRLEVEPGCVVGIAGRTGSGKTTLLRLLFRQYDPVSGRILWDGHDIREYDLTALRSRVGFAPQDPHILNASVRDNVSLFDASVSAEAIVAALREVGLEPWLSSLSDGVETPIQRTSLSASQAQLLSLSRLFLRDPSLVLLDEVTSQLDPDSAADVERAIDRLLAGRTAIIVGHRSDALQRAGRLVTMDHGDILEPNERRSGAIPIVPISA